MSEGQFKSTWRCPECGRENRPTAARCSLCLAPQPGSAAVSSAPSPAPRPPLPHDEDYPPPAPMSDFQRRLPGETILVLVVLCLLLTTFYGVGIALLVALAPAIDHIVRVSRERYRPGQPPVSETAWQAFAWPLAASGVAFLVALASLITFGAVCFPTGVYAVLGLSPLALQVTVWLLGLAGGMLAAGAVAYGLARLFFRRARPERPPWIPPESAVESRTRDG